MVTSRIQWRGRCWILLAALAAGVSSAQAQQPQPPQALDESGFVEAVSGNTLIAKLGKTLQWQVIVGPETAVSVSGTAEPSYLQSGLSIKFSAPLEKKGAVVSKEIEQIEVFTPTGKGGIGIFDPNSPDKPVRTVNDGTTYEVRTKVVSFKPETNELTVTIGGKKVTAKTSPSLAISVNSGDVSLAQEGDGVAVKGTYDPQRRPNPQTQAPGYIEAQSVKVTLSKPLAVAKKGKKMMAKAPRGAKGVGAPGAPAAAPEAPNPFSK
jgi:hypothetical protein